MITRLQGLLRRSSFFLFPLFIYFRRCRVKQGTQSNPLGRRAGYQGRSKRSQIRKISAGGLEVMTMVWLPGGACRDIYSFTALLAVEVSPLGRVMVLPLAGRGFSNTLSLTLQLLLSHLESIPITTSYGLGPSHTLECYRNIESVSGRDSHLT